MGASTFSDVVSHLHGLQYGLLSALMNAAPIGFIEITGVVQFPHLGFEPICHLLNTLRLRRVVGQVVEFPSIIL